MRSARRLPRWFAGVARSHWTFVADAGLLAPPQSRATGGHGAQDRPTRSQGPRGLDPPPEGAVMRS